ncbi:hypothetical protein CPCC7001_1837 [Cyanobium sp. PCC 7001]|nr:hypothetical protein CPCC7001_1837 [Cyanobium sp. PCC 7001]
MRRLRCCGSGPPGRRAGQPIGTSTRAKPRAKTIWRIGTPNTVETRSIARVVSTASERVIVN